MSFQFSSLRMRLLLAYVGLILVGFTILVLLAGSQISSGTTQDFTRGLENQAQLVAEALKEPVEALRTGESNSALVQEALLTYANQTQVNAVVLDGRGRILAGSTDSPSDVNGPEINAALNGSVGANVRANTVFVAAPILEDGQILGVVQLSAPLSDAQALIRQRWLALAGAVLALTILAAIAAYWLATTLTRPLDQLREASLHIAQGDFTQHVPENQLDEFGEVARAFNQMSYQVQNMLEEQRAFASNASHELRTPLTAIRLRSEALREGTLEPDLAQQYVVEIDEETRRLGNLVQDLMLLSQLDAGRLQVGRESVDSVRLARSLIAEVAPEAAAREITLVLEAPNPAPDVFAGQNHMAIVFRNLLSNAMKYTSAGGQIIWQIVPETDYVMHTISDTGQGIAAEDLPRLFERFYRADKSRSRAVPGVGLGLSLTKLIVEFYGGTVWIESPGLQEGTRAFVRWPINDTLQE